jgi:7-cyano-7-deazaguanine synthase
MDSWRSSRKVGLSGRISSRNDGSPPLDSKPLLKQLATSDSKKNKAVVLLSGGLDSATVAAWLTERNFDVIGLTIDYGQRHAAELRAASVVAEKLGLHEHLVQRLDLRAVGGSALTSATEVPKSADPLADVAADIPVTYVPARNTLFLSLALGLAEARGAHDLGIGVNALDYSGYPDCRPEFIDAFRTVANLGTREGVEGRPFTIHAPLQDLSKLQILQLACELGVPVEDTLSCYDPSLAVGDLNQSSAAAHNSAAVGRGIPCRQCDACRLRQRAEQEMADWDPCTIEVEVWEEVPAADIHQVRHRNLREGEAFEKAVYDVDEQPGTYHFLGLIDGKPMGCVTLIEEQGAGVGIRLRGMGVDHSLRGQGVGTRILRVAQRWAADRGDGIWCNARVAAMGLYARSGFRRLGEEFEIDPIGSHYVMVWPGSPKA